MLNKCDIVIFIKLFKSIEFLNGWNNISLIEKLINICKMTRVNFAKKGDVIVHQGEPIKSVYIVKSGYFLVCQTEKKRLENTLDINFFSKLNKNNPCKFERFTERRLHELKGYETVKENYNVIIVMINLFVDYYSRCRAIIRGY